MKKLLWLSACAAMLALAVNGGWAAPQDPLPPQSQGCSGVGNPHCVSAPEIDAMAGGSAIGMLVGILFLLMGQSRRSSK